MIKFSDIIELDISYLGSDTDLSEYDLEIDLLANDCATIKGTRQNILKFLTYHDYDLDDFHRIFKQNKPVQKYLLSIAHENEARVHEITERTTVLTIADSSSNKDDLVKDLENNGYTLIDVYDQGFSTYIEVDDCK